MRDYKQRANMILERRDAVLAGRRRRKKALRRYSGAAVTACAAAVICFGTVSLLGRYDTQDIRTDIRSAVQSVGGDERTADRSTAVTEISRDTAQSVTSHSKTAAAETETKETSLYTEDTANDSERGSAETVQTQPVQTEQNTVTTQVTTVTVTEKVTEDNGKVITDPKPIHDDVTDANEHTFRVFSRDDPMWIFPAVSYGGQTFSNGSYISRTTLDMFSEFWRDETEISSYDPTDKRDYTEPVMIYGLAVEGEYQGYIVVYYKNYGLYILYTADEEEPEGDDTEDEEDIGDIFGEDDMEEDTSEKDTLIDNE